jgi:glycosyltransferase involved in cell wall biosynthesis
MPSKLISYMLAGRPIIAQALRDSDVARTIAEASCGWVVEPDHPQELAAMMQEAIALPTAERERRGRAGREYALKNLVRSANLPRVIAVLEKAANESRQSRGIE